MVDRSNAVLLMAAVMLASFAGIANVAGAAAGSPGDNGYVMMIHGHFEPDPTGGYDSPPPPAQEAFATTNEDGTIQLHVIPYSVGTEQPVVVDDPELGIQNPITGEAFTAELTPGTSEDPTCEAETGLEGHEGLPEACLVANIPADEFTGWNAVLMELRFADEAGQQIEPYSSASHVALHLAIEDGDPFTFERADTLSTQATPFLVQNLVDPQ